MAHAAAQLVGLGPAQPRDLAGHPQHLLLEEQDALGAAQDGGQGRVQEAHRLLAPVTAHKGLGHAPGGRSRLEEGVGHGQIAHRAGPELAQRAPRPLRLALKDADRLRPGQQVAGRRVVQRHIAQAEGGVVVSLHQALRLGQDRQRPDAQQVDLGQAQRLHVAVVELGDEESLGRPLQRQDVGQGPRGDNHPAGMDAQMVGLVDDAVGGPHHLLQPGIGQRIQHIVDGAPVPPPRIGMPAPGQQGHQVLGLPLVEAVGLGRLAHRAAGLQRAHRRHQGHLLGAVGAPHVFEHAVALAAAKVQVDVGQAVPRGVGAGGVEKALKEQIVGDGVDVGDAGTVGNQRVGHAAAGVHRHPCLAGIADDVGHDEKERAVAIAGDGRQFRLQPPAHVGRGLGAVVALQPRAGQPFQRPVGALSPGQLERRPDRIAAGQGRSAAGRHLSRAGQGFGQLLACAREPGRHLVRAEPMQVHGRIAAGRQGRGGHRLQADVFVDGRQQPQAGRVVGREAIDRLGGQRAQPLPPPQGHQLLDDGQIAGPVDLQAQVGVLAIEGGQPAGVAGCSLPVAGPQQAFHPARPAAAEADQALAVGLQVGPGQAHGGRDLALRLGLDQRREPAQRAVARRTCGQQHQAAGRGRRPDLRLGRGHRGRHAQDGHDPGLPAGAVKGHHAVEGVEVGQGQVGHAPGGGPRCQAGHRRRAAEQGIVGMDVQVGEALHCVPHNHAPVDWT